MDAPFQQPPTAARGPQRATLTNQLLYTLQQAAWQAPDLPALYAATCRLCVERGGFRLAWIELRETSDHPAQVAAHAGPPGDLLEPPAALPAEAPPAAPPLLAAPAAAELVVMGEIAADPRAAGWRAAALALGHHAYAAVPLVVAGQRRGALHLHAAEPNCFTAPRRQLLTQLGEQLAHAVEHQQLAAALRDSERKVTALFRQGAVPATLTRLADGVVTDVNDAWLTLSGYTRGELVGRTAAELSINADPGWAARVLGQLREHGAVQNVEATVRFKSGTWRTLLVNANLVELDNETYIFSTAQDLTARVQAEQKLAQMKRLYATLSQVNQTIVRVKERQELFEAVCQLAVQYGEFVLAWIGLLDEATGDVRPVAAVGADLAHWPFPLVNLHEGVAKDGLIATALRTGTLITSQDLVTDPRTANLLTQVAGRDYASVAAVPLRLRGRPIGTLALVSHRAGLFNAPEEVSLLTEMGLDLAFALDTLENDREQHATAALQHRWADAFTHCAQGLAIGLPDSNTLLTANPAFARLQGRPVEDLAGLPILDLYPPEERARVRQYLAEADLNGHVRFQAHMLRADGTPFPVQMDVVSVRDEHGELRYRVATQQDITERLESAEALQTSERTLRLFVENAPAAIAMFDREMRYLAASRRYASDYRLGDQPLVGRSHYAVFPEIPERWKEIHRRCLAGATDRADADPFPREDGRLDWVRWEIHPWHEVSGEIGGLLLFSEVITPLIEGARALQDSERQLKALVSSLDDLLFEFDEQGTYLNVWTANEALLAQPREQLLGRRINTMLGEAGGRPATEVVQRVIRTGTSEHLEYPLEVAGQRHWFVAHVNLIVNPGDGRRTASMLIRDITTRKQAEEAVQASEAQYRALTESFESAIAAIDAEGVFHFANPAAGAALGLSPAAIVGQTMHALFPAAVADVQLRDVRAVIAEQQGQISENQTVIQGHPRWYRTSIQPIHTPNGAVTQALINTVDITERMQMEDRLRESEARNRAIVQAVPDVLFQVSRAGIIVDLSVPDSVPFTPPPAQLVGQPLSTYLPPAVAALVMEKIGEALSTKALVRFEYAVQVHDRLEQHETRLVPLTDDSVLAVVRDITQQRQAEADLQASEQRFRALIEHAPDGITLLGADGRLQFASPSVQHLLGYRPSEVVGRNPRELTHPDDQPQLLAQLAELMQHLGQTITATYRFQHADGTWRWVESRITNLLADPAVTAVIFNFRDITERMAAEQQIHRQVQRLQAMRTIDRAITSSLDVHVTLTVLLDQVVTQLGVDAAAVLLFNPQLQTLEYAAGQGFASRAITRTVIRLGEGWAGRAALERRSLYVPDLAQAGGSLARGPLLAQEGFIAYYGVPLLAKGQIKGVLEIFQRRPLALETQWREFLEMLAEQAAIAVDDAQLFAGLQASNRELTLAYDATIQGWSRAMDLRDKETEGHTMRVTELTLQLARAQGLADDELTQVRYGALLHDIGKLGIPDSILLKPDKLTDEEWVVMRRHPEYAHAMLAPITYLRAALDIPYCHHEKWDGTGYPRGLKGHQIPLAARLFALVDVWDALRSDRPYRAAWPKEQVLDYIRTQTGAHFDPAAVEAFLRVLGRD